MWIQRNQGLSSRQGGFHSSRLGKHPEMFSDEHIILHSRRSKLSPSCTLPSAIFTLFVYSSLLTLSWCGVQTDRQTAKETQPPGSLLKPCRIVWNASGPQAMNQTLDHEQPTMTMGAASRGAGWKLGEKIIKNCRTSNKGVLYKLYC